MAGERDWDRELAAIDRKLGTLGDADLARKNIPATVALPASGKQPSDGSTALPAARPAGKGSAWLRLGIALAMGVSILFWPYGTTCGVPLFGYLAGTAMVVVTGIWSAFWTWRTRMGWGHILSIALVAWGFLLTGMEVLPRAGYAVPTEAHPATWICPR